MPSALHIYPSPFTHESRILKETRSLVEAGLFSPVFIGAIWDEGLAEREAIDESRTVWRVRLRARRIPGMAGKLARFAEWYARLLLHFRKAPPTFVNCHSLSVLPLGVMFRLLFGSRLIYDTHELETETQSSRGIRKKIAKAIERLLIRHVEAVIVVNESIGQWYRQTYGIGEVHVVRNIPYTRTGHTGKQNVLREALGLSEKAIVFLYQGLIDEGRGIGIMLDAFTRTSGDRHIVFLGYGPLVDEVRGQASRHRNIHYHPAVPPGAVLAYTAGADVGLSLIENTSLSYYYSLPNKVFEYIHGAVPVIVSDFPEMAKLVDAHRCGWKCAVDAASLSELVESLTRQDILEAAGRAAAGASVLTWATDEAVLVALYRRLLDHSAGASAGGNQRAGSYRPHRGAP